MWTTTRLTDHAVLHVPVRQQLHSLRIPLHLLLLAQLRLGHDRPSGSAPRDQADFWVGQPGLETDEADSGEVTVTQRVGSAGNLEVHLQCLVLGSVYRQVAVATPEFVEASASANLALQTVLRKIITRSPTARSPHFARHWGPVVSDGPHSALNVSRSRWVKAVIAGLGGRPLSRAIRMLRGITGCVRRRTVRPV